MTGSSADQPSAPEAAFTQGLGQRWFTWVAAVPSWQCWCHASRPCGPFESPKFGGEWVGGEGEGERWRGRNESDNLKKKNYLGDFLFQKKNWLKTSWFFITGLWAGVQKGQTKKWTKTSPPLGFQRFDMMNLEWEVLPLGHMEIEGSERWEQQKRRCRADFNWKHIHGKVGDFRWRNRDFDLNISQTQRLYSYIQSKCLETRNSKCIQDAVDFSRQSLFFSHRMFPLFSSYWGMSRWGVFGTVSSFDSILSEQLEASPGNQSWAYVKIH